MLPHVMKSAGERYVPQLDSSKISYEHWHRYLYASDFAAGRDVLDIASGEGYGSFWLAQTARRVVGVDVDQDAVNHAAACYAHEGLTFLQGSADQIPVAGEAVFDLIVSFETIEHVSKEVQQGFMREVARLLKPDGVFLVSTPNKLFYSDLASYHDEYHVKEFYVLEFKAFLQSHFPHVQLLGQKLFPVSYLWPLVPNQAKLREYRLAFSGQGFRPVMDDKMDLYTLAVCSRQPVPEVPPSLLLDLSERLWRVKDQAIGELQNALRESEARAEKLQAALTARLRSSCAPAANRPATLVIPVFNQVEFTQRCFEVLSRNTPAELYDGVVVDNASTDGTGDLLRRLEGDIGVISNTENLGFVDACNQGAAAATGKYLLFLNNDTEPQPGWLEAMLRLMESDDRIGAVGAKLVYPDGRLQEAGGLVFADGSGWNFGRGGDPSLPAFNRACEVDYCSGACLLVRRDCFVQLGGFDRRYAPAYYEDVDLCFGLRRIGFKVMYCPDAVIIHHEGATAGTELNTGYKKCQILNRAKFCEKWRAELALQGPGPEITKQPPVTADRSRLTRRRPDFETLPEPLSRPLNLLVIDPILPLYDRAAGSLRLFTLLKIFLALGCRVTYIARNGLGHTACRQELEAMGILVYASDPEKMAALGHPIKAPRIDLEAILSERTYDLAWLSFYHIAEQYLPDIRRFSPGTRIFIDTVDVHYLRESRQAELHGDDVLRRKAAETQKHELEIYARADALVTVTEEDAKVLRAPLPDLPYFVVPTIHALHPDAPAFNLRSGLLFVGNFNHPPNQDAVKYFCRDILPLIRRELPDVTVYLVGDNPSPDVKALAGDHVLVTGYVPDTAIYLNLCKVSLAPLRYGAGMKGKIGEALGRGLPVVTTSIGAEGMKLVSGEHVLIADDPESFAREVLRLYRDRGLWQRLAQNGRDFVARNYSPEAVARRVRGILEASPPVPVASGPECDLTSLIVLVHNQVDYTRRCVDSVLAHTDRPFELILVDNASTDGTADYLAGLRNRTGEWLRGVRVLRNESNLGFAAGNNQGLAVARGRYLVLLNNDTVVTPGWLSRLQACARRKPRIGLVGPMSNCVSGPQQVQNAAYDADSLAGLEDYARDFAARHQNQAQPFWRVVGFCMLIKREVIDKIGGLDPRFGLGNFEDDDFSLRAAAAGFESWIAADCFVHHFGSRTFRAANIDYQASLDRNWDVFKRKWGLPAEARCGAPLDLTRVIRQGFGQNDYCAYA